MDDRQILFPAEHLGALGTSDKNKVTSPQDAAALVKSGDVVAISGFGGIGAPEEVLEALEARFLETGEPRGLTLYIPALVGDGADRGANRLAHPGLVDRIVAGHYAFMPRLTAMAMANEIEAYNLPMGTLIQMVRDSAAGKPRTITGIGVGTFVDPRQEGGRINKSTTEDLVEVMVIDGKELLAYKTPQIDVALIRATTADPRGNLTIEDEALPLDLLAMATAARNNGGLVIAQVARIAAPQSLRPRDIVVPACLVDCATVATNPSNHMQTFGAQLDPGLGGSIRVPISVRSGTALDQRKVIARRGAFELIPNCVVNLGVGIPEGVAEVAAEEGVLELITLTAEAGVIGGMPQGGFNFGTALNADAMVPIPQQFDFYDGGGMDVAFLGIAQADGKGDVNVSRFGSKLPGCGGFINISQPARKVVFMGTFTAGGLRVELTDGALRIAAEGRGQKFIEQVEQITFSGEQARAHRQPVLFITERCVFDLNEDGLRLIEVAPGVDIEKDIVGQMGFRPLLDKAPREMDPRIFRPELMGLAEEILGVRIEDRVVYDPEQEILFLNFENLKVDTMEIIRDFEALVQSTLEPVGKRVRVIVNYEGFDVEPDYLEAYLDAASQLQERYFERVTRYTTSAFIRMKLGDSLAARGLASHLYESRAEAGAALRRRAQ